jgi:hypothetical protein
MPVQLSVAVRNAMLDAIEVAIGASAVVRIRTGPQPVNCAAARTGTVLATLNLPSDYFGSASGGIKSLLGTWQDTSADATGTAAHFEFMDSTGTTCHMQGSVTAAGGGGDMTVDNTSFATGQAFNVTTFAMTAPNA